VPASGRTWMVSIGAPHMVCFRVLKFDLSSGQAKWVVVRLWPNQCLRTPPHAPLTGSCGTCVSARLDNRVGLWFPSHLLGPQDWFLPVSASSGGSDPLGCEAGPIEAVQQPKLVIDLRRITRHTHANREQTASLP
jgi:hypothetical protein